MFDLSDAVQAEVPKPQPKSIAPAMKKAIANAVKFLSPLSEDKLDAIGKMAEDVNKLPLDAKNKAATFKDNLWKMKELELADSKVHAINHADL